MNNAKKQRKTIKWERLEISSRKLGGIKGAFHPRMGVRKDRNSKDLIESRIHRTTIQESSS